MQQGREYISPYYPHHQQHHQTPIPPNPTSGEYPVNPLPPSPSFASAPPYSQYRNPSSDHTPSQTWPYPPYSQNPDPVPQSYAPPALPQAALPQTKTPTYQSYSTAPLFPPEQPASPAVTYSHLQQQQPTSAVGAYPHLQQQQQPTSAAGAYPHNLQQPQQQQHQSVPYYPYDAHHSSTNYPAAENLIPGTFPSHEGSYETASGRFDRGGSGGSGSYGSNSGSMYGRSHGSYEQDFYEKRPPSSGIGYNHGASRDDFFGEGVYAYNGGGSEPYGARGTKSSSSWSGFDDYGRSTSIPSSKKEQFGSLGKIVKAVPKVETQQDVKNGVQKFRVKLLPEGSGQSAMDVLCQIGLDGIRMLDPNTSRTLRIYPLETVKRWEVADSSIYSFWAKSSVDIEPRRIRLQSNRYTTNTILDTVAAATVQLKEMGGMDVIDRSRGSYDSSKSSEQPPEKKKGLIDWMNIIKPANEEKDHWVPDEVVSKCTSCGTDFGAFMRKHHCRNCGDIFCDKCTSGRTALTADEQAQPVRVCDRCMAEVTQRLSNAKESANKPAVRSHEDLARKLQEEMEKKCKVSTGSKPSDGSGRRMREVACPTCTVHLQVQVPSSGSETIECGVCQNPFLVSAH